LLGLGEQDMVPPAPTPPAAPEFDDVTELFISHVTDPARELLVPEGERIHRGQLLARLTYRDPEIERRRSDAEARVAEKQASLTLREGKLLEAALAKPEVAADVNGEREAGRPSVHRL
jgi:hypothetical protein